MVLEAQVATSLRRLRSLRNRGSRALSVSQTRRGLKSSWVKRPAHLAHPQQHAAAHRQRTYEPTAANTRSKRGWTSARSGKMYARVYMGAASDGEDVGGGARTVGGMAQQCISADVLRSFSHPSATRRIGWVSRMNAVEEGIVSRLAQVALATARRRRQWVSDAAPALTSTHSWTRVGRLRVQHCAWVLERAERVPPAVPHSCLLKRARPVRGAKAKSKAPTSFVTVSDIKLKPRNNRAASPPARPTFRFGSRCSSSKAVAQP